jgi:hypothetical protein
MEHGDTATARPAWAVPEIAWFLALVGGFAAAGAGAATGVPGLAAVFATAFALGYQALLVRRMAEGTAGLVALAASLGVIVAAIALAGEGGREATLRACPPAGLYRELVLEPLFAGAAGLSLAAPGAAAVSAALLLALARPTHGLAPLFVCMAAAGVLGVSATYGLRGEEVTILAGLEHLPPWGFLQMAGLLLLQAGLQGHEPLLPLDELRAPRRRLLGSGGALLGLGLLAEPLLAAPWAAWAGGR